MHCNISIPLLHTNFAQHVRIIEESDQVEMNEACLTRTKIAIDNADQGIMKLLSLDSGEPTSQPLDAEKPSPMRSYLCCSKASQ